jgi:hypothetical protein
MGAGEMLFRTFIVVLVCLSLGIGIYGVICRRRIDDDSNYRLSLQLLFIGLALFVTFIGMITRG